MQDSKKLFKNAEEFKKVFDAFIQEVLSHPLIGPKLARSKMIVQFQYTDPDSKITINLKKVAPGAVITNQYVWGETTDVPDVTFKQSAEFSNRFWQGKENVIAALAKRNVTASGSITKALQLIPVIRPSFRIYPLVLTKLGMDHLLIR
jgi:putative sterol carrier protein